MLIYSVTTFISAFLLFQVEPMMAKFILPWFGGAQSVWTTCILFFQLLLLAGYAYAHALRAVLTPRKQAIAHVALVLTCVVLMMVLAAAWRSPIMPRTNWKPPNPDFPILRILVLLAVSVGLPYFVLSATGPLLQVWFAETHQGRTPYRLYALSNLGSMLALVTYPIVLEPFLRLQSQARLWSLLYVAFALGIGICAWPLRNFATPLSASEPGAGAVEDCEASRPGAAIYILWVGLAACASLMLLGVTSQICQNVAVIPFLWVLPLAIYLFSFIVCFGDERWYRREIFHPALGTALGLACIFLLLSPFGMIVQIAAYSFLLFCACMVCHGELVRLKPQERHLTAFYLMISTGGALGGLLAAVIAPLIFRGYWELQLSIWACALLVLIALLRDKESWIHERRPVLALLIFGAVLLLPELLLILTRNPLSKLFYNSMVTAVLMMVAVVAFRERKSIAPGKAGKLLQLSVIAGLPVLGGVLLISVKQTNCLIAKRNFYGALSVVSGDAKDPAWHSYVLRHGRVTHGEQFTEPDKRYKPTSYYGPQSGIGLVILNHPRRRASQPQDRSLRLGVVGLGAGTLAAYGEPGDYIRFYEINPAIIELATDRNGYFTYLRDSRARLEIVTGDARLSMEKEVENGRPQDFDILAIDAFSGDAIPVHLLTKEAIAVYLRELKTDGVLAIHITNGYLDLVPVARESAEYFGLQSALVHSDLDDKMTEQNDWVLLARNRKVLSKPEISRNLKPLSSARKVRLWTDDYSNLFQILK